VLTVATWKWGQMFGPEYVNRLRAAFARHCRLPHRVVCVADDPSGIDADIEIVPMPRTFAHTPRCRRRMQMYERAFAQQIGDRILLIDLDIVIVDDITPILDRPEPLVCWKIAHHNVYAGGFVLMDAGVLDPLWRQFAADPDGFPNRVHPRGVPSDQAMLNWHLAAHGSVAHWTEADGFVTYYGRGYEKLEHLGVGPNRPDLPTGARIVLLGGADKHVMDEGRFDWCVEHWGPPIADTGTGSNRFREPVSGQ
jgi:hypothetical protein